MKTWVQTREPTYQGGILWSCSSSLSIVVIQNMARNNSGRKGFILSCRLQSSTDRRQDRKAKQKPGGGDWCSNPQGCCSPTCSFWLAQSASLDYPEPPSQRGTFHSGLSPPASFSNQDNAPQACQPANLMGEFSQRRFVFSDNVSLCQVYKKLTIIVMHACELCTGEAERGGSLEPASGSAGDLISKKRKDWGRNPLSTCGLHVHTQRKIHFISRQYFRDCFLPVNHTDILLVYG